MPFSLSYEGLYCFSLSFTFDCFYRILLTSFEWISARTLLSILLHAFYRWFILSIAFLPIPTAPFPAGLNLYSYWFSYSIGSFSLFYLTQPVPPLKVGFYLFIPLINVSAKIVKVPIAFCFRDSRRIVHSTPSFYPLDAH